ncbi:MAG: hypothetical protein IJG84_06265 [Kiritimatiellae bacterium]|nr:hypothetical protein [Kiritimatiellia bacterium]
MELSRLPASFAEIKSFYIEVFRPLYDRFMNTGAVAQEIHAEMAMALDHLFCRVGSTMNDMSSKDCERMCGHLKRATFDSFKLIYQNEIRVAYEKFMDDKYAEVHDGDFRREITEKWSEARRIADEARALERKSREYDTSWDAAFAKWNDLLPIAEYFNGLHKDKKIVRAKGRSRRQKILSLVWQLVIGIMLIVIGAILSPWLKPLAELFAPAE